MITETVTIERIAYGGDGIGYRDHGKVVFVPGVLPGEVVRIDIILEKERFSRGRMVKLEQASPLRTRPGCPFARKIPDPSLLTPCPVCPGCSYQHLPYPLEVEEKNHQFRDFLRPFVNGRENVFSDPISSPDCMGYRNKLVLHGQRDGNNCRLGYFLEDNRTVFDLPSCPLAVSAIDDRLAALRNEQGFCSSLRDGVSFTLRHTVSNGVVEWWGTAEGNRTWLREQTPFGTFSVPCSGFFQVNPGVAAKLLEYVVENVLEIKPTAVIDLFCGVGVFGIAAAMSAQCPVFGAESNQDSVTAAEYNARQHGLADARFEVRNLEKGTRFPDRFDGAGSLLIVDPPRSGLSKTFVASLLSSRLRSLIYISCAADTLARDLKMLTGQNGFSLERARLFDMFPRTPHFECVCRLRR